MDELVPSGSVPTPEIKIESPKVEIPKIDLPKTIPAPAIHVLENKSYKLNVYGDNGSIRSSLPSAFFTEMSRLNGDIMKAVSPNQWRNLDEVCEEVWRWEKRMKHPSLRTRKGILQGIQELVERTMVITK